ncbi:microsomal glutathione S-transferase 2-like [Amphiura filiformis]|uniref:microsomal glutathione S-transferase 2-like n=1 Tax=Amphiura filiformis TaxID=82378 RepID=UPI003B20E8A5
MALSKMDDYIIPAAVTSLASYQYAYFAMQVGQVRRKLKFPPPKTTGEPEFERAHRAQQNAVEFAPIFFPIYWVSCFFFHPVLASIPGCLYVIGRHMYFKGYCEAPGKRLSGFKLISFSLRALLFMGAAGIATAALRRYADINLYKYVAEYSGGYL